MKSTLLMFGAEMRSNIVQLENRRGAWLRRLRRQVEHRAADIHVRWAERAVNHAPTKTISSGLSVIVDHTQHRRAHVGHVRCDNELARSARDTDERLER